jgi:hypothetical protein
MIRGSGFSYAAIKDIEVYSTMILGFAFLAYSLYLKGMLKRDPGLNLRRVAGFFNILAYLFVLLPALTLTGAWDVIYAFLALGAVLVSINLRTTSGLVISAISIAVYVIHVSTKYFRDSVGWAAMLVVIGFLIIGIGYLTFYLNKKYIA